MGEVTSTASDGVSFSIEKGEFAVVVGQSGAGKTTFLNILAGLESADSGEVFWRGERVDNLPNSRQSRKRAEFMGFVFQNC